jgi:dipeptidyl aminopeptidase/acylaminoacyl peptidase
LGRVITLGHSAGGHLALWVAGKERVGTLERWNFGTFQGFGGVVSLAGVSDLRRAWELRLSGNVVEEFLEGTPEQVPERYAMASPIEKLPLGVPQVLVHGTEDENVPYEISERYYEAAVKAGDKVELVTLEGSGHFEVIDPGSREWGAVVGAVRSLL